MQPKLRTSLALAATLTVCGCGAGGSHSALPVTANATTHTAPGTAPAARAHGVSATLRITVPAGRSANAHIRSPQYVSPATQAIAATFTGTASGNTTPQTFNANLNPTNNPNCTASLISPNVCTITFVLAPDSYSATFTTYDQPLDANGNPQGSVLSASVDANVTIVAGAANAINVTLAGVPTSVAVLPAASATLSGSPTAGYALSRCTSATQSVSVLGIDADGNYIIGPGAPTATLTSGSLTVSAPNTAAPSLFGVALPSAPATAGSATLSAGLSYNIGNGAQSLSASIPMTIAPDICGQVSAYANYYDQFYDLAVDGNGNLLIAAYANRIDLVTPSGVESHFAGSGTSGSSDESTGTPTTATFNQPRGVAVDGNGNVFVADTFNYTIRKISNGNVSTVAGTPGQSGSTDANGSAARFALPWAIVADRVGNLYVADGTNDKIRKIDTAGNVTTYAGTGANSDNDGPRLSATFAFPAGLAIDANGTLYVGELASGDVRKIDPAGNVTTLARSVSQDLTSIAVDPYGTVYVTENQNNTSSPGVLKVTASGVVSHLAGGYNNCQNGCTDDTGFGNAATFGAPEGLAVGPNEQLYVTDLQQSNVRVIQ